MADSVHHHWRWEAPIATMALRRCPMDARLRPSPIRAMLDLQRDPAPIALAAGRPADELIPHAALAAAAQRALRAPSAWRYAGSLGHPELRAWVAGRLARRGVAASAEQVLITNGGQHAL